MSAKSKRFFKRIVSWAGVFFFIVAAGMLYWQLRKHSLTDIAHAIMDIPLHNLIYAMLACIGGYIASSFYDYLALRYVGQNKKVAWWKWMLAGIIGFAISNNAGHAVISGGSIRYRLYTRWRIRAGDIVKMLTFSGFTYFLGSAAIMIMGYFMVPHSLFDQSVGATIGIHALFIFCVAALGAYLAMTFLFQHKNIKVFELHFRIPSTGTAITQTLLGAADLALDGLVLYFCMMHFVSVPFSTFIGIFAIAKVAGVFSQVPGGIGVFETIFMIALPEMDNPAVLFGALLAYRIIYYVLPLIAASGLFFIYENYLRERAKRWLAEAKAMMPNIQIPKLPFAKPKDEKRKTKDDDAT
ncbi:MAG: lysylphosphatidylglycerol synthase domain-containing protein [Proteobacteria bacterium]|nr:lysylphosphatidylglycerol synthase domain-containing protein [Pseudomonadota bacterium]